jgi:hypothetical protein
MAKVSLFKNDLGGSQLGAFRWNLNLLNFITEIATAHNYDPAILTRWMELPASAVRKDFYISRTVKELKMTKLAGRVFFDQDRLDCMVMSENDLTTRALLLAFWTFWNEWFKDLLRVMHYILSSMACKWIGRQELRRRNME